MAQTTSGLRSVLSSPLVYDTFQELMGAGRTRRWLVRELVRPWPGCRILDLGCGTAEILRYLPVEVEYWGFDPSQEYIDAARERYGRRAHFQSARVEDTDLSFLPPMDIVLAVGILHHLDDGEARKLLGAARTSMGKGARLISIDPVFTPRQNPIARLLISLDRGRNVRTPEAYSNIAHSIFPRAAGMVRGRRWIPYTHWIMECSAEPGGAPGLHE